MLPLDQLGGRLGRKAKRGAKMTKRRGAKLLKEVVIKDKKGDNFFMGKISCVITEEKLIRCHIVMVWGRKIEGLA